MKTTHFLYASLMVLGMSLGSCSSELDAPAVNGDGNVTFTAQLPGNIGSRAYADGETATTLKYAVYEAGTTNLVFSSDDATPAYTYENLTFKISFNLVKGKSYDFAFWAQAADAPYTFTADATGVTVAMNYDKDATANNEKRDAFFNVEKGLKVEGSVNKTIELRRPFAQLNIGTNDLAEFEATKSVLGNISVTVKDVYNTLDLFSGVASDPKEVTFTDVKPEGEAFPNVKDGKKYDYLAMDYILTGTELVTEADVNNAQKETKDVTIAIFEEGKAEAINTIPVSAAPFQRNYRTNIYGSLLTSTVDWTIEIKPGFNDPDNNEEVVDVHEGKASVNGKVYDTLAEAMAAAGTNGTVKLAKGTFSIKGLTWPNSATLTFTGAGQGNTVLSDIGATNVNNGNLTFNNLTLEVEQNPNVSTSIQLQHSANMTFNNVNIKGEYHGYATGTETFNNCSFTYSGDPKGGGRYAAWAYGARNMVFNNCTFDNSNSAKGILVYGVQDDYNRNVTVKNCTFTANGETEKGAIEIHTELFTSGKYAGTITIDNTTCSATYGGGLWNEVNNNTKEKTTTFKVIVDGETVQAGI